MHSIRFNALKKLQTMLAVDMYKKREANEKNNSEINGENSEIRPNQTRSDSASYCQLGAFIARRVDQINLISRWKRLISQRI